MHRVTLVIACFLLSSFMLAGMVIAASPEASSVPAKDSKAGGAEREVATSSGQEEEGPWGLCFRDRITGELDPTYWAIPRTVRARVAINEQIGYNAETGQVYITGTVTDILKAISEVTVVTNQGHGDYACVPRSENPVGGPYISDFDILLDFETPAGKRTLEITVYATNVTGSLGSDGISFLIVESEPVITGHANNNGDMDPAEYCYASLFPSAANACVTFETEIGDTIYDSVPDKPMMPLPPGGPFVYATEPVALIECFTETPPSDFKLAPEVRSRVLFWKSRACTAIVATPSPQSNSVQPEEATNVVVRFNMPGPATPPNAKSSGWPWYAYALIATGVLITGAAGYLIIRRRRNQSGSEV